MLLTIYRSNARQQLKNVFYPIQCQVNSKEDLESVVKYDHVSAEFKDHYRSNHNYIQADHIAMDVDNDQTNDPSNWLDIEILRDLLPEVEFYLSYSRNHLKQKGNFSPRPRFHVYFPIATLYDVQEYKMLKQNLTEYISGFDLNALDASRLLFGVENPQVVHVVGTRRIDQFLDERTFESLNFPSHETITEGQRNKTLNHFAGRVLKRLGESMEAKQLFLEKSECCNPPLQSDELEAIWRSAVKFYQRVSQEEGYLTPEQFNSDYQYKPDDYSDVGQALALSEHYSDKLCYSGATEYLVYNGNFWDESDTQAIGVIRDLTDKQMEEVELNIKKYTQLLKENGGLQLLDNLSKKKALDAMTEEQSKIYKKLQEAFNYREFVLKRRNQNYIHGALRIAQHLVEINPMELDADAFLLNTPTGTYDLRTGNCMSHSPNHYITKQTAVGVKKCKSQIWEDALDVFFLGDKELKTYVQEIIGMSLIGKVYLEALIIAYGDGSNGKSTFWNTLLRVLGTYGDGISADVLVNQSKRNVKPEIAETKGKRLLIAAELQEGMSLNTSIIKQLCSTDPVRGEKKFKKPFSFIPSHTLVLYTNHLPQVNAIDNGTWRRLIVIPFEATIKGKADIKNYTDYLVKNCGEEILWWAIQGAQRAIEKNYHLIRPHRVQKAIDAYKQENNWFGVFIEACCEVGKDKREKSGQFYEAYRNHCYRTGELIRNSREFYKAVESSGFERKKHKDGSYIYGVSLINEFI